MGKARWKAAKAGGVCRGIYTAGILSQRWQKDSPFLAGILICLIPFGWADIVAETIILYNTYDYAMEGAII